MIRSAIRVSWHLASELLLFILVLAVGIALWRHGGPGALPLALAGVLVCALVLSGAVRAMWRAGTLQAAWRFPRVDALMDGTGLVGHMAVAEGDAWMEAAEAVLAALDRQPRAYREFFPNAKVDLRRAVLAAVTADSPGEMHALVAALREIHARLVGARGRQAGESATSALADLHARAGALADAVESISGLEGAVPVRKGGLS